MLATAFVSHQVGNRIRYRIPARKGDEPYFAQAEQVFAACPGVAYVETNALVGSILLLHNTDAAELEVYAAGKGLFTCQPPDVETPKVLPAASAQIDAIGDRLATLTHGTADLHDILFVGLVGASIVQVIRGRALGPATSLLANAAAILSLYRSRQNKQQS